MSCQSDVHVAVPVRWRGSRNKICHLVNSKSLPHLSIKVIVVIYININIFAELIVKKIHAPEHIMDRFTGADPEGGSKGSGPPLFSTTIILKKNKE